MNREVIEMIKKTAEDTNSVAGITSGASALIKNNSSNVNTKKKAKKVSTASAIFSIAASIVECGCLIALACCKDEKKGDAKKKG